MTKPISDKDWQARDDAYTLARAKEIKADPKRLLAAAKAAKEIAKEQADVVSKMKAIVRKAK